MKDRVLLSCHQGYEIPCSYGHSYIGKTGRTIEERLREHIRHSKFNNMDKSAVALHAWKTGHAILFDDTRLLAREERWGTRRVKEAVEITKHPQNLNAVQGLRRHDARSRPGTMSATTRRQLRAERFLPPLPLPNWPLHSPHWLILRLTGRQEEMNCINCMRRLLNDMRSPSAHITTP